MKLAWRYQGPPVTVQRFLQDQGFSRAQLKRLKFRGGQLFVNHKARNTAFLLHPGDQVLVLTAPEVAVDTVVPFAAPISVVYEDDHFLVVAKPAGLPSIPDVAKHPDTMANRVKAYLLAQHAESAQIHVVTRLDRDTSGLMLFAKHSLAHSLIDQQLHTPRVLKQYLAIATNSRPLPPHGWLCLRVGRTQEFYMKRGVTLTGKPSVTEYRVVAQNEAGLCAQVTLHTGRTHQIRVHLAAVGHPLYGDSLYGGPMVGIARQALHCAQLQFDHPFTQERLTLTAPLPPDMATLSQDLALTGGPTILN